MDDVDERTGERGEGRLRRDSGRERGRQGRARLSCNACRARKTRCVDIDSGACRYCRSYGLPCETSVGRTRRTRRPFYQVSDELYEYSIKLLRHFVPEEELPELTVENIEHLMQKLDGNSPDSLHNPLVPTWEFPVDDQSPSPSADAGSDGADDTIEADEHPLLQEELGCMMLDCMGTYRYVGANSPIRWFNATRAPQTIQETPVPSDPKIITPPIGPLTSTTTGIGSRTGLAGVHLPPRQLCSDMISRFFDHIHCTYWFYSAEQFHLRLDHTLDDGGESASSSWLCALYSIFAIGSMRPEDNGVGAWESKPQYNRTSLDYLSIAKGLSTAAADEADLDSVKAFGLLSLAMHAACHSITAYLHIGTAVRLSFSLGLHRDIPLRSRGFIEQEQSRRLWWTIYILDYEMASRFGYPCTIIDKAVFISAPQAAEQILEPGPGTPLDFQTLLASFARKAKAISHECFLEPAHTGGSLPLRRIMQSLASLRRWHSAIPAHLRWDSPLHIRHRRAVCTLHLRFWGTVISLTRPFLLLTAARPIIAVPARKVLYERMINIGIEAAEAAVHILRRMREDQTLSSLMFFDSNCIGEAIDVLILALQKLGGAGHLDMLRFCLETFRGMEKIGWCEKLSPQLEAAVQESGFLQQNTPPQPAPSTAEAIPPMNLDQSQFDDFDTLDLESSSGLMEMFTDSSFSGSQFFV